MPDVNDELTVSEEPERKSKVFHDPTEAIANPDRFAVGNLPYLDEVSAQIEENRRARAEERTPRTVRSRATLRPGDVPEPGAAIVPHDYFGEKAEERVEAEKAQDTNPAVTGGRFEPEDMSDEELAARTDQMQDDSPVVRVQSFETEQDSDDED